jgi:TonB family protein
VTDREPLACVEAARADLAFTDDLTGLFNRRLLSVLLGSEWPAVTSRAETVSLVVIDLDHFKEINDTFGHLVGDVVIQETAAVVKKHFRADDILLRYGGDELVIVLPGVDGEAASRLAERARDALAEHHFSAVEGHSPITVPVSFSTGVASFPQDGDTGQAVLDAADQRLIEKKRLRNLRESRVQTRAFGVKAVSLAVATAVSILVVAGTLLVRSAAGPESRGMSPVVVRGLDPARESELLARVKQLQEQLAEVSAGGSTTTSASERELAQQHVDELVAKITALEAQLRQPVPGAPSPGPSAVATTGSATPTPGGGSPAASPTPGPPHVDPGRATTAAAPQPTAEPAAPVEVGPVLLHYEPPTYPPAARHLRKEAAIEMHLLIGPDGKVIKAAPVGAPVGFGLDQAAVVAATHAVYRPATRDGAPVAMETTLVIRFRLIESR